jgi:chitodextrinase
MLTSIRFRMRPFERLISASDDPPASRTKRETSLSILAIAIAVSAFLPVSPLFAAPQPVATFSFDAGGSATLGDDSGNALNGTLVNGPTWTSGKYDGGLAFDGVDDYVSIGDVAQADGLASVTVSAWVKFAASGGGAVETHLVDKSHCSGSTNGGPWELGVGLTQAHKAEFVVYPQGGHPYAYAFSGPSRTSIDDGAWHYVVGHYDGSRISISVDGLQENSALLSGAMPSTSYAVELGGRCNGYSYPFKGTLDDVRIYGRALTQNEILADMTTPVAGETSPDPAPSPTPPPDPTPPADTTPPSTPSGLSSTSVTSTQVGLTWQASTDNMAVTGYRVFRNGTLAGTASSTSYVATGLSANTAYAFTVSAFDAAGNNSTRSSELSVRTAAGSAGSSPSAIATYDFEAGTGATLNDRSGNAMNGTLVNGPTWTSGMHGGGLAFDGVDDYVTIGDAAQADGLTAITVSAWVKFAGNSPAEIHFIDKSHCSGGTNGGPWELGIGLTRPHKAEFVIYPQGGNPYAYVFSGPSSTSVDDGAWHHVAGRYDGSRISIWVDGVQENSTALSGASMPNTTFAVELGGHCNGYAYPFKGTLDDVRIYGRALTANEILTDMSSPVGGGTTINDTAAPSIPTGLSSTSATATQIGVTWQASTDNVGVAGYNVYRNGVLSGTVSTSSHTSTGLSPNTGYVFTVSAFDAAGNHSAQSAPLSVNTAASSSVGYATSFDRNEYPISEGGRWHRASNQWTDVQTVGGVAFGTNGVADTYDDSYALLSGFGADQTLEAVVFRDQSLMPGPSHEVELLLRATDGPSSMRTYECLFDWTGNVQIVRWNGSFGDVTFLPIYDARGLGRPLVTGDVIKATIIGNTIRLYINGQQMGWTVDSAIGSGQPGISFFIRPGGSQRLLGLTSFSASSP